MTVPFHASSARGTSIRRAATVRGSASIALLVASMALPTTTPAQRSPDATATSAPRPRGSVLARTSLYGALSGTVMAMGFYFLSDRGERSNGCQPINCALPFLSVSGALAGLFIGRELDAQHRAFAPRVGESIAFGFNEAITLSSPIGLDVRDSLIAVVSDSGAQILSAANAPKALRRRASGLSAMRQVAIVPSRGALVLGTGTALWETSLLTGPASRLADGAVDALAASSDAVMSASGKRVRWRRGSGESLRTDSLELSQSVAAIAFDSVAKTWWVATDSTIVQINETATGIQQTGLKLALPATARAIAMNGEWVAAALGDAGIIAWSRANIAAGGAPSSVRVTNEPRFAYDLAFLNGSLFVAGGVDGLFQISLTPAPRVIGSSRQLQFATSIRAGNGVLWVGDRNRRSVVRVTP